MKTGTTYLQGKAYANEDALSAAGVDMAGRRWGEQVWGVQELLGMGRTDPELAKRNAGAWDRLAEKMRTATHRVSLLTMEFLAFADRRQAQHAVETLEGCDVRVVLTVRDTAAVVPALWQTTVTSGGTTPWPRFRAAFRLATRGRGRGAAVLSRLGASSALRFEEAVNIARMLDVWTSVLPPEQVHVVVVPGPDAPRDRLWRLFCEVLEIDPDVADAEGDNPNESLGYASAELVRRVNAAIEVEHMRHQAVVKNDLGHHTLGNRRGIEERARLDRPTLRAALRWNDTVRRAIRRSGVVVHGDLADLPVEPLPGHSVEDRHVTPSDDEILEAAAAGLARLVRLTRRRTKRLMRPARAREFRQALADQVVGAEGWADAEDPVGAAVADLVVYSRGLIELRDVRDRRKRQEQREARRRRREAKKSASSRRVE